VDCDERHSLKRDAVGPFLPQLAAHVPTRCSHFLVGVEMSAERADAMRISAAKGKGHPSAQIVVSPVNAILDGPHPAARPAAIRHSARDNEAFVEVYMHVDEARPQLPFTEVDHGRILAHRAVVGISSLDCGNATLID